MISKRLYKIIQVITALSRFVGASTLHFNENSLLFSRERTKHNRVCFAFNCTIFWAIMSFSLVIKFRRLGDVDRYNITLAYWLAGVVVTIIFSIIRFFEHDVCLIINGYCTFIRYIHRVYMPDFNPNKSRYNGILESILLIVGASCLLSTLIVELFLLYDPRGVIFLGDWIPEKYFYFHVKMVIVLYHTYLNIVVHVCLAFIVGAIFTYAFYVTPFYIRELRLGKARKYTTLSDLRKSENLRNAYRSLQVLQSNCMCMLGVYLVTFNAQCMFTSLYCNFVLIRYWRNLATISKLQLVIWAIMVTGIWCVFLEIGRLFFQRGQKVLGSWKGKNWPSNIETRLMKRFIKSCKPIVISYGSQFVIRRVSVLVFLRGVIRGTFRALLTTKR